MRSAETEEKVRLGEVCAKCLIEFDGQHGKPVLCHRCHTIGEQRMNLFPLPKAWLEEKAK